MPANLNALIRYKQIDRELKNPYLKTTIKSLQKACSEQLAEHRGIYKLISERTIRDDIRIMRSEALGFNAPIVVKNGEYSYSDENYTIFNTELEEPKLLFEILSLLKTEKSNINSPKIDTIISALELKLKNRLPYGIEDASPNLLADKEIVDTNLFKKRKEKTKSSKPSSLSLKLRRSHYIPKENKQQEKIKSLSWYQILELF